MEKKILSILVMGILVFGLIGCGKKSNSNNDDVTKVGKLDLKVQDIYDFNDGLARIRVNDKLGFIDKLGNTVVEPKYDYALNFSDGMALVCNRDIENSDFYNRKKLCGYIDKTGKEIIELKYEDGTSFEDEIAIVKKGIYAAFIDKTGKELTGFDYTFASSSLIGDNMAMVDSIEIGVKEGFWSIINLKDGYKNLAQGTTIKDSGGCSQGLCAIKPDSINGEYIKDAKFGYIDYNGKVVIDYKFDKAFSFGENGLALVVVDDKVGFINTKGEYVIEPIYRNFSGGMLKYDSNIILITEDSNIKAFDKNGKELFTIPGKFYEEGYREGYALIKKNNSDNYVFIDETGKEVFEEYYRANSFSDGLALVKVSKDEFKFINTSGKTILSGKITEEEDSGVTIGKTSNSSSNESSNISSSQNSSNESNLISNNSASNSTNTKSNSSSSSSNTSDGIKIGNTIIKYGTYNGDAAVMGDVLIIKSDGSATLNGEKYTYKVGKHNFAQDSSGSAVENALILEGKYTYYYYVMDNGKILSQGSGMDYVYSGK